MWPQAASSMFPGLFPSVKWGQWTLPHTATEKIQCSTRFARQILFAPCYWSCSFSNTQHKILCQNLGNFIKNIFAVPNSSSYFIRANTGLFTLLELEPGPPVLHMYQTAAEFLKVPGFRVAWTVSVVPERSSLCWSEWWVGLILLHSSDIQDWNVSTEPGRI